MTGQNAGPPGQSPARFLNVISTKRSGHHAMISWIEDGSAQRTQFINNAAINDALLRRLPQLATQAGSPETIILNYEGVSVPGVRKVLAAQAATGARVANILFVRDPLNACASLMQRKAVVYAELVMVLRQLFALRDWLRLHQDGRSNADLVFYNRWLADEDYRRNLADRLGVSPVPVRSEITTFGGGSSFQDSQGGSQAAPRLLSRWQQFKDDALFRALITHREFAEVFAAELNGTIKDARGDSDFDADRAAFLEEARRQRRPNAYVDRLIAGLSHNPSAFEKIEALKAGVPKRLLILKTHVTALVRSSRASRPVAADG